MFSTTLPRSSSTPGRRIRRSHPGSRGIYPGMVSYDDDLEAQRAAAEDAMDTDYATSVMGGGPKSGVSPKPLNPGVEVPGRPVDDPMPEFEPEPPEIPP